MDWCGHKSRNAGNHKKAEEARNRFSSREEEGAWPSQHLDFGSENLILDFSFQTCERTNVRCFWPSLWWFITALGSENTHEITFFPSGYWEQTLFLTLGTIPSDLLYSLQMVLSLARGFIHMHVLNRTLLNTLGPFVDLQGSLCSSMFLISIKELILGYLFWFLSLRDYFLSLPGNYYFMFLKTRKLLSHTFVCFVVGGGVVSGRRVNLIPVIPSWLKPPLMFVSIFFIFLVKVKWVHNVL